MTYREMLRMGENILRERQIEESSSDTRILFEHVTGIDRTHYFLQGQDECPEGLLRNFQELLERRAQHIPVQYLTGKQEFMGLSFSVDPHVLIPRQDTELLVLEAEKRMCPHDRVLDMCTGSGCIIISLSKRQEIVATAADISENALAVAKKNAEQLGAKVSFVKSDLFVNIQGVFDCIVSNPPYIRSSEIQTLMPEVRCHEPHLALDGQEDGLYFYRRMVKEAIPHLKSGGWLLFEIGCEQGSDVAGMLHAAGYEEVDIKKDLAGLDRVVIGRRW